MGQLKQFTSVHELELALITHAPELTIYPVAQITQEVLVGQLIQLLIVQVVVGVTQARRFGLKIKPAPLHVLHTEVVHLAQFGKIVEHKVQILLEFAKKYPDAQVLHVVNVEQLRQFAKQFTISFSLSVSLLSLPSSRKPLIYYIISLLNLGTQSFLNK